MPTIGCNAVAFQPCDVRLREDVEVTAEQLIEARRPEDIGHSLWTTFQRVQENVMRGGQPGRSVRGRRMHTRPVAAIDRGVRPGGVFVRKQPNLLYKAMLHPLIPYTCRGMVWYQGEANTHPGKGDLYQHQLPTLVTDWRKRWGNPWWSRTLWAPAVPWAWTGWPSQHPTATR